MNMSDWRPYCIWRNTAQSQ